MCDTLVVVHPDRVLFAKNSDRDPNEAQALSWHPAADHPPGSTVTCTWITIPQVAHTHAVLLSRPFWMFGAEIGTNEHGVTIGNEAVFTNQPYAATGLTGMDMLRLALERARDAGTAVDVMLGLLRDHGQGGGCGHENRAFTYHNSFIVADRQGAFVVETAGKRFAVERVRGARSISNGLTIDDFAASHSDRLYTAVAMCRRRRATTQSGAERAQTVADMMSLLRTHEEGGAGPTLHVLNGGMGAPCMHAGGLAASSQSTASWVAQLSPAGDQHWATGTSAPCTSLFKPVDVHSPVDLGPWPTDRFDPATTWWRHERLHRAVSRDPARLLPRFWSQRNTTEHAWLVAPPRSADAFARARQLEDEWYQDVAAHPAEDARPAWARRYWGVRDARAGLPASAP